MLDEDLSDQDFYIRWKLNGARLSGENMRTVQRLLERCVVDENGCWVWMGPTSGNGRGGGYGRISFCGVTYAVHRLAYQIWKGPIPPRKQVDHECCNRLCFNPEHLTATTHKLNQRLRDDRIRYRDDGSGQQPSDVAGEAVQDHRAVCSEGGRPDP